MLPRYICIRHYSNAHINSRCPCERLVGQLYNRTLPWLGARLMHCSSEFAYLNLVVPQIKAFGICDQNLQQ